MGNRARAATACVILHVHVHTKGINITHACMLYCKSVYSEGDDVRGGTHIGALLVPACRFEHSRLGPLPRQHASNAKLQEPCSAALLPVVTFSSFRLQFYPFDFAIFPIPSISCCCWETATCLPPPAAVERQPSPLLGLGPPLAALRCCRSRCCGDRRSLWHFHALLLVILLLSSRDSTDPS